MGVKTTEKRKGVLEMLVSELKKILERMEKDGKDNMEIMFEDDFGYQFSIGRTYEFLGDLMLVQKEYEFEEQ